MKNILAQKDENSVNLTLSQCHHLADTFEALVLYAHEHGLPVGWAATTWTNRKADQTQQSSSSDQLSILGGEA